MRQTVNREKMARYDNNTNINNNNSKKNTEAFARHKKSREKERNTYNK